MFKINLADNIYFLGINDRRSQLFENYWPLPKGVTYNSYLIVDEKVCLIDTVDRKFTDEYFNRIDDILCGKMIDYLVINHVEPDHSGSIKAVLDKYPDISVVGNKKTFPMLENFYGSFSNFLVVDDGDSLELGRHKLNFYTIPMVHWPESMVTYESMTGILFSNDAFGSFGAHEGGVFDDEIDISYYEEEIMRYFTNIVGKYCPHTQRALNKLEGLDLKQIAPSHGIIWRNNIDYIIGRYQKWSSYKSENGVVIIFGSMYGNTEKMADAIARELSVKGVKNIRVYDASKTHISYIINEIFKFKGLILGSCAYNNEMFPAIETVVTEIAHKGIKNHFYGLFGSFSWNGGGVKNLQKVAESENWELVSQAIEIKGSLKESNYNEIVMLAEAMWNKLAQE